MPQVPAFADAAACGSGKATDPQVRLGVVSFSSSRWRSPMDRERVHIVLKTVACLFALLAISAGTARAQAEATVRGDVVAVANGSALSGVQVTLERPAGES